MPRTLEGLRGSQPPQSSGSAPLESSPIGGGGGGGGGGGPPGEHIMRPSAPPSNTKSPSTTRSPSTTGSTQGTKKAQKQSFLSDPAFIQGYRDAHSTIYERNDYASAIDQLKALGHDDYANVANLIGYSYRKLGACPDRHCDGHLLQVNRLRLPLRG